MERALLCSQKITWQQPNLISLTSERGKEGCFKKVSENKRLTTSCHLPEGKFAIFLKTFIVDPFEI